MQELSLRMERLTDEASKKRHQLDHETTETLSAQVGWCSVMVHENRYFVQVCCFYVLKD